MIKMSKYVLLFFYYLKLSRMGKFDHSQIHKYRENKKQCKRSCIKNHLKDYMIVQYSNQDVYQLIHLYILCAVY